jgi:hypothetical protein
MPTAVEYQTLPSAVLGPSLLPAVGGLPLGYAGLVLLPAYQTGGSAHSTGGHGAGQTQGLIIVV